MEKSKKGCVLHQLGSLPCWGVREGNLAFQSGFHNHLWILGSAAIEKNLKIVM